MNANSQLWLCEGVIAILDFLMFLAIALPVGGLIVCLALLLWRNTKYMDASPTAGPAKRQQPAHFTSPRSLLRHAATPFRPGGIA